MLNSVFKIVPPSYPLTPPLGLVPLRYGICNDNKPPFLSLSLTWKRECQLAGPSTCADETCRNGEGRVATMNVWRPCLGVGRE